MSTPQSITRRNARLVIDALGAPEQSGGMKHVVKQVFSNWNPENFSIETFVIGPKWLEVQMKNQHPRVKFFYWPNNLFFLRIVGQLLVVPVIGFAIKADNFFSFNCVISPLIWSRPTVVLTHDWRHINRPREFSFAQLLYRKIWLISAKKTTKVISVSEKTLEETKLLSKRSDIFLWKFGNDHPANWIICNQNLQTLENNILAFGHHTNKRPELTIAAFLFAQKQQIIPSNATLTVLGIKQDKIQDLLNGHEISSINSLIFPGFVSEAEYQRLIAGSRFIVMASTDEGYGIPIVEAAYFGKRSLVTTDSGLLGIHQHLVLETKPEIEDMAKQMSLLWCSNSSISLAPTTWKSSTDQLFDFILKPIKE